MNALRQAAQAVVDRWDGPDWTREDMTRINSAYSDLRTALAAPEPYDQQALELCNKCGWKAVIPGESCLNCARDEITKERDALQAALKQTLSSMGQQADTLRAERDALIQAAKLALDALGVATTHFPKDRNEVLQAIAALKKAGV